MYRVVRGRGRTLRNPLLVYGRMLTLKAYRMERLACKDGCPYLRCRGGEYELIECITIIVRLITTSGPIIMFRLGR